MIRALLPIFLLASCGEVVVPPLVEEELEPIEISLVFEYSCRYLGLTPRHTFRADVDPDTIEVAYELVVNDVVAAFRDAIGTFVDTLYVDWGSEVEYRVEYVFAYEGWRVEGVTRCRVQ